MTSWRSLVRAQLTPPDPVNPAVCVTFYVINPQSDYGKARVGRPKIKPALTGRLRALQCTHLPRGGSYHPEADGTAGFSREIAELCNGSTYDSDSYCLGSNPSSAAICLHGQAVKTSPSHGENWGSSPHGGAKRFSRKTGAFFFCIAHCSGGILRNIIKTDT